MSATEKQTTGNVHTIRKPFWKRSITAEGKNAGLFVYYDGGTRHVSRISVVENLFSKVILGMKQKFVYKTYKNARRCFG